MDKSVLGVDVEKYEAVKKDLEHSKSQTVELGHQLISFQDTISKLEKEIDDLKSENASLRINNNRLTIAVENLTNLIGLIND
jgi:chromosome segregation ATPase